MQSVDILTQLRSLNWLREEAEGLPEGSMLRKLLYGQEEVVRHRLPPEIFDHYKWLLEQGRPGLAATERTRCGACKEHLPASTIKYLKEPGHYVACPHCGTFICTSAQPRRIITTTTSQPKEAGVR